MAIIITGRGNIQKEKIPDAIILANKIIDSEGTFPDSFFVLQVLGEIYSMGAFLNYKNISTCNEFISKAEKTQKLASKYIVNEKLVDPEEDDEFQLRLSLTQYYTNFCTIGFTKYLLTDCKDHQNLLEINPYFQKAITLSPENSLLNFYGTQLKKISAIQEQNSKTTLDKKRKTGFFSRLVGER